MASTSHPYGLRPVRRIDGTPYAGEMRQFAIKSGYATDINPGDIVAVGTDGYLARVSGTSDLGDGVVGVFMGVQIVDNGQTEILSPFRPNWVGGTTVQSAMAYVVDDPNVAFQIQADDTLAQTALGACFAVVNPGTGNAHASNTALDASSAGTSGPLKLIDFVRAPGSAVGDAYTDVIVKFNPDAHAYTSGTGVA
jgi:hypothetical protein